MVTKNQFMRRAIKLSRAGIAANAGGPFGAVVVRKGEIVGEGWNQVTSSNDPTAHAEVMAIRAACASLNRFELSDCELYTSCEPCPMCLAAIYWARIGKLYYANTRQDAAATGFDDDLIYQEIAKPLDARQLPVEQLGRDEAIAVFEEWINKPDKIRY